jgi:hypothetical protein
MTYFFVMYGKKRPASEGGPYKTETTGVNLRCRPEGTALQVPFSPPHATPLPQSAATTSIGPLITPSPPTYFFVVAFER